MYNNYHPGHNTYQSHRNHQHKRKRDSPDCVSVVTNVHSFNTSRVAAAGILIVKKNQKDQYEALGTIEDRGTPGPRHLRKYITSVHIPGGKCTEEEHKVNVKAVYQRALEKVASECNLPLLDLETPDYFLYHDNGRFLMFFLDVADIPHEHREAYENAHKTFEATEYVFDLCWYGLHSIVSNYRPGLTYTINKSNSSGHSFSDETRTLPFSNFLLDFAGSNRFTEFYQGKLEPKEQKEETYSAPDDYEDYDYY